MNTGVDDLVRAHCPKFVDLTFTDLAGHQRHITLSASMLDEKLLRQGVGFDGSSVSGFASVEFSDLRIIPDPATAWMDPFCAEPTLSMICDAVSARGGAFPLDPRTVAKRAEKYLTDTSIADRSLWGPEPEFYLFDSISFSVEPLDAQVTINSGIDTNKFVGTGYLVMPPLDRFNAVRAEMTLLMAEAGIPVKYQHSENGIPGQSEIEPLLMSLVEAADAMMRIKYIVKNVAARHGLTATFMPKPVAGEAGSGLHVHQKLMRGKTAVFAGDGYAGLSDLALFYTGGLLKQARSLAALVAPSTNSYRRLIPGYEAPVLIGFSEGNRTACVRIPAYAMSAEDKRIEFRPPDATCNIYLALSAMLLAGIWGIDHEICPEREGYGPFDQNIYEMEEGLGALPASLDEALKDLEHSHEFLLTGNVFCPELIETWINMKRNNESRQVTAYPNPMEYVLYYNC